MARFSIIRQGDKTTHGGMVIGGSAGPGACFGQGGRAIARVGDKVTCPKHGAGTIVQGTNQARCQGRPIAYSGALTSCGARLIPNATEKANSSI